MIFDRMRVYDAGRFTDTELPDWYHDAGRLSQTERLDWHHALERVLGCEYTLLTEEGMIAAGLEIRVWPSEAQGILVVIETPIALVEQVVVANPADWLAFLAMYLAPLMATSAQSSILHMQDRIANALIAWARHGKGTHVDRETGLSRIDLDNDRNRRLAEQARLAMALNSKGGGA
ncbi:MULTISPECIES: hypothetical protein [Rhodobacterales]|uniref:hypothetical protein n=1 Tax=Rhodobacterales TaxID=204455 RepID=UPI000DEAF6A2|nr:hypothetical protein DFO80_10921 [Rhodobacter sp. 140A]